MLNFDPIFYILDLIYDFKLSLLSNYRKNAQCASQFFSRLVIEFTAIQSGKFPINMFMSYWSGPGGRLNKKDGLTRYGDSHVKDKTS